MLSAATVRWVQRLTHRHGGWAPDGARAGINGASSGAGGRCADAHELDRTCMRLNRDPLPVWLEG